MRRSLGGRGSIGMRVRGRIERTVILKGVENCCLEQRITYEDLVNWDVLR